MEKQILEDVRTLIRENILPRITELEIQLKDLRRLTWPMTQAQMEMMGVIDNQRYRREFLKSVDLEEAELLIALKRKIYPL